MEASLWVQLPIVGDLFYSCCCNDKTRAQLKVVILRDWLAACKSAGNLGICGFSEVDVIACFRSALPKADRLRGESKRSSLSRKDSLDMRQFSLMLLLLSARRLNRGIQGIDATNCSTEWVAAVADTLKAIGFVSNSVSDPHEHSSEASSPPPFSSTRHSFDYRSPNASYLRSLISKNDTSSPLQPHELLSRRFSSSRDGASSRLGCSLQQPETNKPMKFLWQPQLFSNHAEVLASPGPYELPIYMRRDWEVHRLRKNSTGKLSMLIGLPPSRARTARTFSDIPYIGYPQEVSCAAIRYF